MQEMKNDDHNDVLRCFMRCEVKSSGEKEKAEKEEGKKRI